MLEGDEDVVVDLGALPPASQLGVHRDRRPEKKDGLVDHVTAEVGEQAASLGPVAALAPRLGSTLRSPSLVAGLEAPHVPKDAGGEQPADGQEVAVPPSVVEDTEHQAPLRRFRDDPPTVVGGDGERLVDDDGQPGVEGGEGHGDVGAVRRGDHDELDTEIGRRRPQGGSRVDEDGTGVGDLRERPPFRVRGDDGGQLDPVRGIDERSVEGPPREAVADERHPHGSHRAYRVVLPRRARESMVTAASRTKAVTTYLAAAL